ncbi:hypothetical protein TorRG33x02_206410 [Trema orientale]|uniref:Uncharacterized protein n=1 Tax=Trema orientale TaxID=63057 RepID=A0A2P5EDG9_TREOI|nr:hypothetical protein TorRG33x02_206410 [Trema orientale]
MLLSLKIFSSISEQLASPTVSLFGKMMNVSPPLIDDGLRFMTEKKKNVDKLASEEVQGKLDTAIVKVGITQKLQATQSQGPKVEFSGGTVNGGTDLLAADEGMKVIIQSPKFLSSGKMMKVSLLLIEDSLRFMTEKEKNVDKLTDEWIPIYQNLTGLV